MAVDPPSLTSSVCVTATVGVYVTVYVPSTLSSTVSVSSAFASPAFFSVSVLVCELPPDGVQVSVTVKSRPPVTRPMPSASVASIVKVARSPATARVRPWPTASNFAGVADPRDATAFTPP